MRALKRKWLLANTMAGLTAVCSALGCVHQQRFVFTDTNQVAVLASGGSRAWLRADPTHTSADVGAGFQLRRDDRRIELCGRDCFHTLVESDGSVTVTPGNADAVRPDAAHPEFEQRIDVRHPSVLFTYRLQSPWRNVKVYERSTLQSVPAGGLLWALGAVSLIAGIFVSGSAKSAKGPLIGGGVGGLVLGTPLVFGLIGMNHLTYDGSKAPPPRPAPKTAATDDAAAMLERQDAEGPR